MTFKRVKRNDNASLCFPRPGRRGRKKKLIKRPLIQTSLSQNPALSFLHTKQTVNRDVCKPNSISPLARLCNCQDASSSGDWTAELVSQDWWTLTAPTFIFLKHNLFLRKHRGIPFSLSVENCRVVMCLHGVFLIPNCALIYIWY